MKNILFLICLAYFLHADAQPNLTVQLDKLLESSAAIDAFSGNVLIEKEGKLLYKKSVGYANWQTRTLLNDSTLFNIGSIGKDFTQVIIAQLAEEHKLNLDNPLNKYLNLFPDSISEKITVRMLLQHRSGLGDYHQQPFHSLADRLEFISKQPLEFAPGTDQQYSNSGYVVLAAIIEKVTGKLYEENVGERILKPLKMKHTLFIYPNMEIANRASATMINPGGDKENEHEVNDELTPSGDGGEYATAGDLLKFYSSLLNDHKLLSETSQNLFFSRFNAHPDHSLSEMKANKVSILAFAGGLNGWNTCADLYISLNYIVISMSNFDQQPAEELNHRIHQIIMGEKVDAPKRPRFEFAFDEWKNLGSQKFINQINDSLKEHHYEEIQGPFFYNEIGEALYNQNHFDDAVIIFSRNTQLFPQSPLAWQWLGMCLVKAGRENEAYKALGKCLELDPHNSRAQELLDEME